MSWKFSISPSIFPLSPSASGSRNQTYYSHQRDRMQVQHKIYVSTCYTNSWSWSSGLREPSSPSIILLVMLALWTRRTSACTTSDIGGLNSGSGWNSEGFGWYNSDSWCSVMNMLANCIVPGVKVIYLDTQRNDVCETGQGFGRVQALERWVDHPVQRIDVMQLGCCPPDKWLLCPESSAATIVWHNSQGSGLRN